MQVTADEAIFVIGSLLHYRRNPISQMNSDQALKNTLSLAYQRLLSHQSPKGAFSFCQEIPSTFLTASALDVLQRLHSFYNWPLVDGLVIGKTLDWLVSQQSPDGSFREKIVFSFSSSVVFEKVAQNLVTFFTHMFHLKIVWTNLT